MESARGGRSLTSDRKGDSRMFDNVMVGIDGEQGGRDAIELARQLVSDDGKTGQAAVKA